jgi:cysteate synthase
MNERAVTESYASGVDMSHFKIRCRNCNKVLDGMYCAFCEHCQGALLVTEYLEREFRVDRTDNSIWRYNWVPVHSPQTHVTPPVVYRSEGLARELGLENLHIIFNGYHPAMGALVETCTFKEFEAAMVLENARENDVDGLVVASAGNTARAFAHLSSRSGFPVIIVVPLMCIGEMWYLKTSVDVPTLIVSDGDYSDAIDMAKRIALVADMPYEGGVKNIAKRDGLGVVLLETVSVLGRLPDHYFQAVGSGAGAIAAWEMCERFQGDERFRGIIPKLHLAQNLPFAPMTKAWHRGERELAKEDLDPALIAQISTRVLSTRYPAYSVKGGVYDALRATDGKMYGVTNDEMQRSKELFERCEGVDIVPAAAVAVGALAQAVENGAVGRSDVIALNITGGGEDLIKAEGKVARVEGEHVSKNASDETLKELVCKVMSRAC